MTDITESAIREALAEVQDPDQGKNIVELGFVQNITSCGGAVKVVVQLNTPPRPSGDQIRREAHSALAAMEGVETVNVELRALAPEATPPWSCLHGLPERWSCRS